MDALPPSFPRTIRNINVFEKIRGINLRVPAELPEFCHIVRHAGTDGIKVFRTSLHLSSGAKPPLRNPLPYRPYTIPRLRTSRSARMLGGNRKDVIFRKMFHKRCNQINTGPHVVIYAEGDRIADNLHPNITLLRKTHVDGIHDESNLGELFSEEPTTAVGATVINHNKLMVPTPMREGGQNTLFSTGCSIIAIPLFKAIFTNVVPRRLSGPRRQIGDIAYRPWNRAATN
jgi:hypothetical protein